MNFAGYIFFGSVVQIVADIEANVRVAAVQEDKTEAQVGYSPPALDETANDIERYGGGLGLAPTAYVVVDLQAVNGWVKIMNFVSKTRIVYQKRGILH